MLRRHAIIFQDRNWRDHGRRKGSIFGRVSGTFLFVSLGVKLKVENHGLGRLFSVLVVLVRQVANVDRLNLAVQ